MLRNFILPLVAFTLLSLQGHAQHHEGEAQEMFLNEVLDPDDSLKRVLHEFGRFEGHFRSYFMNTVNDGHSPDYFALATGGGLAYYSPVIRNFQVGMSGFIIYNLASSALGPENGFTNRYELALFDVTDPDNHEDLDRLENLYLRYYISVHSNSFIQFGKFHVNTPLLNLQDTRMRPNLQEGLWTELKDWEKIKFRGGWLWGTSPRSTVEWYGIGESLGIYGSGKAVNGLPANYKDNIESKRILIGNLEWQPMKSMNYQYWNYHVDNLFNMALQKIEYKKSSTNKTWMAGLQYLWQKSISDEIHPAEEQYISPGEQSHTLSGRVAVTRKSNARQWSLNYTRITSHGRFLFPREWGTETLYTYNNRERNEGTGDVHAVMLEHFRYLDKDRRLTLRGRGGVYKMPPVTNFRLNKYSVPSYYHFTLQANYRFSGFLKGMQTQMLYTFKGNLNGGLEEQPYVTHNKTEMHHFGVRLDYYF